MGAPGGLTISSPRKASVVETNDLRIHTWFAIRACGREHLGGMDRGRAAWDPDKPRPLGHRGHSFRCRRINPAAVSAEKGPCRRSPGMGRTCGDYVGRWGTDGVDFLWRSPVRTGGTRGISLYRPDTPVCCDRGRCRAWRGLHPCEKDRARPDRCWGPRHCLGRRWCARNAAEHWPRHVHRRRHVVGLLCRGYAESTTGRASRRCYRRGRVIDRVRAGVRQYVRDRSVKRALA